jgi:hypothetical protein
LLGHDPGADYRGEQEEAAKRFGEKTAGHAVLQRQDVTS